MAKTSTLRTAKDLEGKVAGLNALGVGFELNLEAWFAQSGADVTKLKLVEVPTADMGAALDPGTIDAAALLEPAYTVAHEQYGVQMISNLSAALGSRYLTSGWFSTREFAQRNPDLVRRFARAMYATQTWANNHQAESAAILSKYSKMDLAGIRHMAILFDPPPGDSVVFPGSRQAKPTVRREMAPALGRRAPKNPAARPKGDNSPVVFPGPALARRSCCRRQGGRSQGSDSLNDRGE